MKNTVHWWGLMNYIFTVTLASLMKLNEPPPKKKKKVQLHVNQSKCVTTATKIPDSKIKMQKSVTYS